MKEIHTLKNLSEKYIVSITDQSVEANDLILLKGKTTVPINTTLITSLTGQIDVLTQLYQDADNGVITGLGDESLSIENTEVIANSLNSLNSSTEGTIDGSAINTIEGYASALLLVYNAADQGEITGLIDKGVTIYDNILDANNLHTLILRSNNINIDLTIELRGIITDFMLYFNQIQSIR